MVGREITLAGGTSRLALCPRRYSPRQVRDEPSPALQKGDHLQIATAKQQGGIVGKLGTPLLPPGTVELNILTQNTWGLPGIFGTDRMPRMERLACAVRGYDVVGLQETFSEDCKVILDNCGYPSQFRQDRGGLLSINSGLTTLSRYPLEKVEFRKFKTCTGNEFLVRKGILFTRLNIPGFGCVDIYNTHFQAGGGHTAQAVRRDQIQALAQFIRENDVGNPTILVGDFNMSEDSSEYADLMKLLNPLDTFRQANPGDPGVTIAAGPINPYNGKDEGNERLDYVFVLPHPRYDIQIMGSKVTNDRPLDGTMLSDHFGVVTRLRLRRRD